MPRPSIFAPAGMLALSLAWPAGAQMTVLDSSGTVTHPASIATGSDGLGLIVWTLTDGTLKVGHCQDAACTSAMVSVVSSQVSGPAVVAIGGDGLAVMTYPQGASGRVLAHCNDIACTGANKVPIPFVSNFATGLAVGGDGLPFVATGSLAIHCQDPICSSFTSVDLGSGAWTVAVNPSGLPLVVGSHSLLLRAFSCQDPACASFIQSEPLGLVLGPEFFDGSLDPLGLSFGGDGRALMSVRVTCIGGGTPSRDGEDQPSMVIDCFHLAVVAHCADTACTDVDSVTDAPWLPEAMTRGTDGLGLIVDQNLSMHHCQDLLCNAFDDSPPLDDNAGGVAVTMGQDGLPLIAFRSLGQLKVFHCYNANCSVPALSIDDNGVQESNQAANLVFTVTLSAASAGPATVDYATADGTATAPADYIATSGVLSFAPGQTSATLSVPIVDDNVYEPDETFTMKLSNAVGATVAAGQGTGTIFNDDLPPEISISSADVLEGNTGVAAATLTVSLSHPSALPVALDWQTDATGGTATPGADFLVANGSLSFNPGDTSQSVIASVFGDTLVEPDEFFLVRLDNATGATFLDNTGQVTITDDDAPSLSSDELVHGSSRRGSFQSQPGVDYYRLGQAPYSSWEVVVDGPSAGASPLGLERLAADNATVLQSAVPVAGGSSLSLRWSNDTAFPVLNQHLRVSGCGVICAANAGYRVQALETTGRVARFNNSASQATVVVLQNTGASATQGTLWLWDGSGTLLWSQPFALGPRAGLVSSTASIPALAGASGTITVTSDAAYGVLQGKAAAVEPATGFTFDTPLEPRPR